MVMCVSDTPVDFYPDLGLYVKREDLCCPPGPHFSKSRGVYAHISSRRESVIGVLDTSHSQGGWATAQACKLLGKHCVLYYPLFKGHELDALHPQQQVAEALGAGLIGLTAGRSAILYHRAKKDLIARGGGYMMPNALKLPETVWETAREFGRTKLPEVDTIVVSASSGTIAAGVIRGVDQLCWPGRVVVHLGYSRPERAIRSYMQRASGICFAERMFHRQVRVVDEGYGYKDSVKVDLPFPSNAHYDAKAVRWWLEKGRAEYGEALLWNVG